jgi:hypothetical protein
MADQRLDIPIITTDLASTEHLPRDNALATEHASASGQGHNRTPSDPTLLSPILKSPRLSVDAPTTPASPGSDDSSINVPPSPTLSNRSSVRWGPTTTDLRTNQPEASSGMATLGLLEPGTAKAHKRKGSDATFNSARTVADDPNTESHGLAPLKSRGAESVGASTLRSQSHPYVTAFSTMSAYAPFHPHQTPFSVMCCP